MITSVSVADIDDSDGGLGGRTLNIQAKSRPNFMTPTRPMSVREFGAKEYLGFRGTLEGHLGAVPLDIYGTRFAELLKTNEASISMERRLTHFADLTCCFENFATLDMPSVEASNSTLIKLLMETQAGILTLGNISLPPIHGSVKDLERIIKDALKVYGPTGKGIVPQLSLREDPRELKKKLLMLEELAQTGAIQIVDLIYADPSRYRLQYLEVWKMKEAPMIFNCSRVPKTSAEVSQGISMTPIVLLQRYGIDTFTPRTNTSTFAYIAKIRHTPHPSSFDEVTTYSWACHKGGSMLRPSLWRALPSNNVECNCKVCRNLPQDDILNKYCLTDQGFVDDSAMLRTSYLHDGISSQNEYNVIKSMIRQGEMDIYLNGLESFRTSKLSRRAA